MDGYGYDQLQRDALGFILEAENWPVFLHWVRENAVSDDAAEFLDTGMRDLHKWRMEWMKHSPDPYVRAIAATINGAE